MIKECSECGNQFTLKGCRPKKQVYFFCCQPCARKHISRRLKGESHPSWKGGTKISNGYRWIHAPNHPHADSNRVLEHRLVIEKHLGRYLRPEEHVHHINENRLDNRLENLQIMTHEEHISHHHKGKKLSDDQKTFLSQVAKKRWEVPSYREKMTKIAKKQIAKLWETGMAHQYKKGDIPWNKSEA